MVDQLARARESIRRAADRSDEETVREQLRSIDLGLMEETESASTEGDRPVGDQLEQVEKKLAGLAERTDGAVNEDVREARDAIDAYRRAHTRDW